MMNNLLRSVNCFVSAFLFTGIIGFSQTNNRKEIKLNYDKIYAYGLDANIKPALKLVDTDTLLLSLQDREFKRKFESRFKFDKDETSYPEKTSPVDDLVKIYKDYWRMSLLDTAGNYDMILGKNLIMYLISQHPPAKILVGITNRDTIGTYLTLFLKDYLSSLGLYTTGFGRTGKLIDLLIWRSQKDTAYNFSLTKEITTAPVSMMDEFITLGWEEYATFGRAYPGGWTTSESLFCVKKAYDLSSENFLISYLAHESRHFADYKIFPKLKSADLEYRAKLTELSMAKITLYKSIQFFITNANYQSSNPHSIANYCVIRDLSHILFKKEFESNIDNWKKPSIKKINKEALKILNHNTQLLKKKGKEVTSFIKA